MAEGLFGDAMATNNFMVGVAFQAGTIPLKAESIEAAIKNSGVGVEHEPGRVPLGPHGGGRSRLRRGRDRQVRAEGPSSPQLSAGARAIVDAVGAQGETRRLLEVRVPDLIAYQDEAYAKRYAEVVKRVVAAEQKAPCRARAAWPRPRRATSTS